MKSVVCVSGVALAAALAGQAWGQEFAISPRFEAKNVCDYIAGSRGYGPFDGRTPTGMVASGDLIRQGVIDVDGDGTTETVITFSDEFSHEMSHVIRADGSSVMPVDGIEDFGGGSGFLPFAGRWYFVNFATSYGGYPLAAYTLEKGTFKAVPACTFDNETAETMGAGAASEESDIAWCADAALKDADANRLKPAVTLDEPQKMALTAQANADDVDRIEGAGDIYKPTTGPFAGALLWKVMLRPFGPCPGYAFLVVKEDGAGGYTLAPGDMQAQLDKLQGSEEFYNNSCAPNVDLMEANGRFFVERYWGGGKQTSDHMLLHSLQELKNGEAGEVCVSSFEITPKVTWMSPDLSK